MLRFLYWIQRHELAVFISIWALYTALALAVGTRLFPPSAIHDFNMGVLTVLAAFTFVMVVDLTSDLTMRFVSQLISAYRLRSELQVPSAQGGDTQGDGPDPLDSPGNSAPRTSASVPSPQSAPRRRRAQRRPRGTSAPQE